MIFKALKHLRQLKQTELYSLRLSPQPFLIRKIFYSLSMNLDEACPELILKSQTK